MATNTLSSTIVPELLTNNGDYLNWSAGMKNYLLAQDLWDIVEGTTAPPEQKDVIWFKAWTKKNAFALHAIQISCGLDILSKVREMSSAKKFWDKLATMHEPGNSSNISANSLYQIVWDKLATLYGPGPRDSANITGEGSINCEHAQLRRDINTCDWVAVKHFLNRNPDAKSARISDNGGTVLHMAVSAKRTDFVEKLVAELMSKEELEITDDNGLTALAQAAILENEGMVECMRRKNAESLNIPDYWGCIPLVTALEYGNIKMANYLYSVCQTLSNVDASTALTRSILLDNFGLALKLLERFPDSAIVKNKYHTFPLPTLTEKSSTFRSGKQLVFWKNWIYNCISIQNSANTGEFQIRNNGLVLGLLCWLPWNLLGIKQICKMKLLHRQARELLSQMCHKVKEMKGDHVNEAIIKATKGGLVEFIKEIFKVDAQLLLSTIDDATGRDTFFCAVLHRQDKIFSLIHKLDAKKSITNARDQSGNTILHMAAMLEPSTTRDRIAGEALKMQSELLWFKEVETHCSSWINEIRNNRNMTPKELFTHNHKDMREKGEKWMKATATSCTVVGALIITIMFNAAFTLPGSNNKDIGFPMFPQKKLLMAFIISDALSLVSSSTSVLVFLLILTSRYAQEDFRLSLPIKMIIGLFTLFFSIATMMVSFCVGLFIMLPGKLCIVIPVTVLAGVTVIGFGFMQIPLLVDMLKSTVKVWSALYGRKRKHLS